jgi:hypothetical protein
MCAAACPVNPVVDICERGSIQQIDCSSFNLCLGDRWETKYCDDGLVMAASDKGLLFLPIIFSYYSPKEPSFVNLILTKLYD